MTVLNTVCYGMAWAFMGAGMVLFFMKEFEKAKVCFLAAIILLLLVKL